MKLVQATKKPVTIEAVKWDGGQTMAGDILEWIDAKFDTGRYIETNVDPEKGARIELLTLEGTMTARPGDWIIRGVKGEFYPCKPGIFDQTYDYAKNADIPNFHWNAGGGYYICSLCERIVETPAITSHTNSTHPKALGNMVVVEGPRQNTTYREWLNSTGD